MPSDPQAALAALKAGELVEPDQERRAKAAKEPQVGGECGECGAPLTSRLAAIAHFEEVHPVPGDVQWKSE